MPPLKSGPTIVDPILGVSLSNPLAGARTMASPELAKLTSSVGRKVGVNYAAGVGTKGKGASLLIWTKDLPPALAKSKTPLKQLGSMKAAEAQKLTGLKQWSFDKKHQVGAGVAADAGKQKSQVAVTIANKRLVMIGFYYDTPAQLAKWKSSVASLHVNSMQL